jgi:hypothetical protein
MKALCMHKRFHKGGTFSKVCECGKPSDMVAVIAQEMVMARKKTFECKMCGKIFYTKPMITKYVKIHKGEMCFNGNDC